VPAAHPIVQEIRRCLGRGLRFAFRHFPLSRIHPHAERAAEAAEAATAQGKFWQMHDQLFEHQGALDDEYLLVYPTAIGLDVDEFWRELLLGVRLRAYAKIFSAECAAG
jgi:formate-nitrite transporter family protein